MRPSVISLALFSALAFAVAAPASAAWLTPSSLSPAMSADEQSFYSTLGSSTAQQNFLATRNYVRQAQAVVAGTLSPANFPSKKPVGFTVAYLLPDDPTAINNALGICLTAKYSGAANPWA